MHLTKMMMTEMQKLPYVHILGSSDPEKHHGIVTFTVDGVHPHDIAAIFDSHKVDIRAGHHCAQPLMDFLGIGSCCRASLARYNTEEDVDALLNNLENVRKVMGL